MSDLVIETTGLRKEFRSLRGDAAGRRHRAWTWRCRPAACTGSSGPTVPARPPRSGCCSAWPARRAARCGCSGAGAPAPAAGDRRGSARSSSPRSSRPTSAVASNLLLLARRHRRAGARGRRAIETVKLGGREKDRYKAYSLGMKQRLAIAATLLKQPDLLILDEPTNGLDPAGIREIRETIRDLGASGVTVLLSSHILAEVQQVCTSATIIGNGKLLASGTVDELLGVGTSYRVAVPDPDAALHALISRRVRTQQHRRRDPCRCRAAGGHHPGARRGRHLAHRADPAESGPRGLLPPAHRSRGARPRHGEPCA